ncbi:MAG: VTT domain-containing protein [Chloroflexi bacterium]|nr:VTT domain-containing protein [Chloroflexota bacterium]
MSSSGSLWVRGAARLVNGAQRWATGQLSTWQRTLVLAIVIGVTAFGLVFWATGRLETKDVGYTGVFLVNLIGSASLILPVPGAAAACIAAFPDTGLHPFSVGLLAGIGQGIGEITGYLAGKSGQTFVSRNRHYARVRAWTLKGGGALLFVFALIPNPVMDLAGIAAGSLGYPFTRFLLFVATGKILRSIGISYGCYYGVEFLTRLV